MSAPLLLRGAGPLLLGLLLGLTGPGCNRSAEEAAPAPADAVEEADESSDDDDEPADEEPAEEPAGGEDRAERAAPQEAPRARRSSRPTVPRSSDDSAWGVQIPIGCTPTFARREWIESRCRLSVTTLARYYRFRFPLGTVEGLGRGYKFTPGVADAGYAIFNPAKRAGVEASRLMLFPAMAPDDDGARRLLDRLVPRELR